ncbi:2-polyprenyl-6-methoxyphenol hydroxylase-like FAD-dependent oxidoreductase [Herbihabitans rhizosphaerae]|uniref:2-polyprenyl-6-methoxyphenol hydroxylase-like FAD-dependent oxidoreductase n=1 Tax=Herbihabitans rhizosphaerae TaxID=1872711 RepID=A0A4Q7KJ33_9PSEU|nr:FAD-dependent monooxygenase [Herbihabitans rhizosphaerae]RZS36559.1 2-polyprenyl-6-methoxyphenol hydroxylase-like FAD-dependent oxidoreductase [Herbihabitans rhizosphaerae]
MAIKKVLVSGASVAGPTLAYWLAEHGFEVTVVERAPAPRPGGQAIDLRGAAREVAERMGVLDEVRAHHTGAAGMVHVDGGDRPLVEMPADLLGDSGGVIAEIEILRGDLVRILYGATEGAVEYLFDDTITTMTQHADGVDVTFENRDPRRFDLVIGADGLHSVVRSLAFGPESGLTTDGGFYKTIFSAHVDVDRAGWQVMHNMPRSRMASVYPLTDTERSRALLYFGGPVRPIDRRDIDAQKRFVAEVYADAGWHVPELLEQMWRAEDFYLDRESIVRLDTWHAGRVALVGDSVFAGSIGMGTSMAVVGAYVLAGELAAAGGDHTVAFPAYQREMAEYVRTNQKGMPGGVRAFLPSSRAGLWLRTQTMRLMLAGPWRTMLTGDLQETSNGITLKDYRTPARR